MMHLATSDACYRVISLAVVLSPVVREPGLHPDAHVRAKEDGHHLSITADYGVVLFDIAQTGRPTWLAAFRPRKSPAPERRG